MRRLLLTLLLAAFLLSPRPTTGAVSPIKDILVTPKGFISNIEPVVIQVRLNDTTSPRLLVLIMDCSAAYMESRIELEPKGQPPVRTYRQLPAGICQPVAILYWREGDQVKEQMKKGPEIYVMGLASP